MTTLHLHANTTATPEQFIDSLTDFGPGRAELFGNSADKDLVVHEKSVDHADSNAWGGKSSHTYDLTEQADGTTDIDYTVVRDGKNLRGRFSAGVFATVGKGVLVKAFQNSVHAIEQRS